MYTAIFMSCKFKSCHVLGSIYGEVQCSTFYMVCANAKGVIFSVWFRVSLKCVVATHAKMSVFFYFCDCCKHIMVNA